MRPWVAVPLAALGLCIACSSFHDDDTAGPDAGSDGQVADGTLSIAVVSDGRSLVPGRPTTVQVALTRGADVTGPVTLRLKSAPDGITASDVIVTGDSGALAIVAPANAPVGGADAVLEATAGDITATTSILFSVQPTPGSLDATFGVGSILTGLFAGSCASAASKIADVIATADNTVYVVGACESDASVVLERRLVDGAKYAASFSTGAFSLHNPHRAMMQKVGAATKLVVAGGNASEGGEVGRILDDGTPDDSVFMDGFPAGTIRAIPSGTHTGVAGLAITPSTGDVYVGWDDYSESSQLYTSEFLHLTPGIQGDPSAFGDGTFQVNVVSPFTGISTGMAVSSDERSLVVFGIQMTSSKTGWIARRYNLPSGLPDTTFASESHPLDNLAYERPHAHRGPLELADGSFVTTLDTANGFYVVKVDKNGVPVGSFGGGPYTFGPARGIVVSGDGFVVATAPPSKAIGLVRLDANGKPDVTFGTDGFVSTALDDGAVPECIVAQKSGRLLVGVTHTKNGVDEGAVVAFWP